MDDHHIGKLILTRLRETPDLVHQIEVCSGERETCKSFLSRTIKMATGLKNRGLKLGDVVLICAKNHIDATVPIVACQYLGLAPVNLAVGMSKGDCLHLTKRALPKIIFCDREMEDIFGEIVNELNLMIEIVVFREGTVKNTNFTDLLESSEDEDEYRCVDFNPAETVSYMACSSGSTGFPKLVTVTHQATVMRNVGSALTKATYLLFSPLYWMTAISATFGSCIHQHTVLQTAEGFTVEILRRALDTYKPKKLLLSPYAVCTVINHPDANKLNFSSVQLMAVGGSSMNEDVLDEFKKLLSVNVIVAYGISEIGCVSINAKGIRGSVGKPLPGIKWKIVDVDTGKNLGVKETGELCVKTKTIFKEYYKDLEATKNAFDDDGYYKTGDMVYYDEDENFYIVDRIKEMYKYRNYQVSTGDIEMLICSIPGVIIAAVVGIPHPEDGEHPLAFVQLAPGSKVTAREIKNLVKEKMREEKHLKGGVVFLDKIPLTPNEKINRKALRLLKYELKGE